MRTYIFWIIVTTLIVSFVWLVTLPKTIEAPQGCTVEARICPDGSAVGREGPNCEFAPCPEVTEKMPIVNGGGKEKIPSNTQTPPLEGDVLPPPEYERPYDGEVACTMDAKMCEDGSYVGRIAPHCNFAPCPDEEEMDTTSSIIDDVATSSESESLIFSQ